MSFLAPFAFAAAAIVVPALLILYFLKLRRREARVPSTLLWRRAVQDLQVNAPFQRLRRNLLLLLQLLVLLLAIFALARPIIYSELRDEDSVVLLIDRSASMNTLEGTQTRLELAKQQARRLVRTLNRGGGGWRSLFGGSAEQTRVLLIAFADRATIVWPFTTNLSEIGTAIGTIQPSDARTNIREALDLADAYLTQTRVDVRPDAGQEKSRLVLLSDGAIQDVDAVVVRQGNLTLIPIGAARDNAGITSLRIQRGYEQPDHVSAFVQVGNFGPDPVETDVSFYVDGVLRSVETIQLRSRPQPPPGTFDAPLPAAAPAEVAADEPGADEPGAAQKLTDAAPPEDASAPAALANYQTLLFEYDMPEAGVIEVRLSRDDVLAADNRAAAIVPPPRRLAVLLVSAGNPFLERILKQLPLGRFAYRTPEQYESAAESDWTLGGRSVYDVVVFDKHATARLPVGNYVFIGALPQRDDVRLVGKLDAHTPVWWDEAHPIMRHVAMENVDVFEGLAIGLPKGAETLVEGPAGPMIARYAVDGRQFLVQTFAIERSTWWAKLSFAVYMYNAFNYLGGGGSNEQAGSLRPGETAVLPVGGTATEAIVERPDGRRETVHATGGSVRFAATEQVGLYRIEPGEPGQDRVAVNLVSAAESDVTPRTDIQPGGLKVELGQSVQTATPEVWRWFAGVALAVLLLEWYIYNRRVMV